MSDRATLKLLAKLPAGQAKKKAVQFAEVLIDDLGKQEKEVKRLEKQLSNARNELKTIKDLFKQQTENAVQHERIDDQLLRALGRPDEVSGQGVWTSSGYKMY